MNITSTILIKNIDFTDKNGVHFGVNLPGRVTVLSGDSATGKTLLWHRLKTQAIIDEDTLGVKDIIEIFTSDRNNDLEMVRHLKGKLIIIDNGDILLHGHKDLADYINCDFDNQYLIFSRGDTGISTNPKYRGKMIANGKEIKAIFNSLGDD